MLNLPKSSVSCIRLRDWMTCLSLVGVFIFAMGLSFFHLSGTAAAHEKAAARGGTAAPVPAGMGIDSNGRMQIQPSDRCPLCAMVPAKYPKFSCAVKLTDNRTYYFCCPRCLLRVWAEPERFLNVPRKNLSQIVVRHYFTGEQFDGKTAFWVSGSDVSGPMGPAIVPLKSRKEAEAFKKRHGAKRVFLIDEPTPADWKEILKKP